MKGIVGIGINGTLSSNYEKKGPIQCFMAIRFYNSIKKYKMVMQSGKGR
jgi:hypothetical protein